MKTTDGGANWFGLTLPIYRPFMDLFFPTQNTGYVAGSLATVLKTTDSGNSWVQQSIPPSPFGLMSIHFINANTGYTAGPSGRVLKQ
jgi:photosystem II stability/assembly factor-like uncharacterized protein